MSALSNLHDELKDLEALLPLARSLYFQPGDELRRKGHHYNDAFVILRGSVLVDLGANGAGRRTITVGPGRPIGEIGFVHGYPATATVTAQTEGEAIVVDDATIGRIEKERPHTAARLLRLLAVTASERMNQNLALQFRPDGTDKGGDLEIRLCRTPEMLERAQRLRYEVYCDELGRKSPYADHAAKRIRDDLDGFGHTFIAEENDTAVATIRANLPREGDIGVLYDLYGMAYSPHFPEHSGICTKFIVRRDYRSGPLALRMIAAITRFGEKQDIGECYIDCIPSLLHYYQAIGFRQSGEPFLHRENGLSIPMRLDLIRYSRRLQREPTRARMVSLYLRAKAFKSANRLLSRMKRDSRKPATREASP